MGENGIMGTVDGYDDGARPGDAVVLSPACSSFDMFRNYEHRAQAFRAAVERVAAEEDR